jgi:hypothetical protein
LKTSDTANSLVDTLQGVFPGSTIEHVTDQPGDDVDVFRIETNYFNFLIERSVTIFAYHRKEDNLIQFSDRGLYSYCLQDRTDVVLKRHRNFIRAYGYLFIGSESDDNSFVVNTPTVNLDDPDVDLGALMCHYISLLTFCGEV